MRWLGLFCAALLLADANIADGADDLSFIDAHVHLNQAESYLNLMEAHDIPRAIIFWGRSSDNEALAAHAAAHPDKQIGRAHV